MELAKVVVVRKFENSAGAGLSRQGACVFVECLLTVIVGERWWCCAYQGKESECDEGRYVHEHNNCSEHCWTCQVNSLVGALDLCTICYFSI